MSDYIPITAEVRSRYLYVRSGKWLSNPAPFEEEFDRWLQKIKADMIRELIIRGPKKYYDLDLHGRVGAAIPIRWLEDEADMIQG